MNQPSGSVDPKRCPLCGNENECGMLEGQGKCWCFTAIIAEAVIGQVPEEARDLACICEKCAKQPSPK